MQVQALSQSQPNPEHSSHNNTQSSLRVVFVQFCTNCDSHLFTIRHDQQKYLHHYEQIKAYLEQNGFSVKKKPVPKQLCRKSPYCPPNVFYRSNGQIVYFPQIGSFELYLQDTKVFSKLESNKWPNPTHLLQLIQAKQKQKSQQNQNLHKQENAVQNSQKTQIQATAKAVEENHKKQPYLIKKTPLQSARYSLDKRNLLVSSQTKKNRIKSHRFSYRTSIQKDSQDQKQTQIIKMYTPKNKLIFPKEEKNMEIIESLGHKSARVNIYLQPIFPKTKVNLENYQKHRIIVSQKIHRERVTFQASKSRKQRLDSFQLIDKKYLKAKFNKDSSALSNIREATQQQQPKIQIIKTSKIQEKSQEIMKDQHIRQTNQLTLPRQNKEDFQWKDYKNTDKSESNEQMSKEIKPQASAEVSIVQKQDLAKNISQQKNQNNAQYEQQFQAEIPKIQNKFQNKQNVQQATNNQKVALGQQRKHQVKFSEAKQEEKQKEKQEEKSQENYQEAFEEEENKQNELSLEAAKDVKKEEVKKEEEQGQKSKGPQSINEPQNLQ